MVSPVDLTVPYGTTERGFLRKNIFSDQLRLLGPESRTVIDIGAHHGEEVATYLAMFPDATVHAIEPTPDSLEILTKNWGHEARVQIHGCALAEREGEAILHTYPASECNSLTPYAPVHGANLLAAGSARVTVTMTTLDQFCAAHGIGSIDLLKLDTQGAELRVLAGASVILTERRVRLIALEVLFVPLYENQADADAVIARLRAVGYELYDWYNFSYDSSGQVLFGDAMFVFPQSTLRSILPSRPLPDLDERSVDTSRVENARLRSRIADLEARIGGYKSKIQDLRQRLKRGESNRKR